MIGQLGPALFEELLDDAAIFPPGNKPVGEAVAAHDRHTAAWYAPYVGPFVVPAARWDELVDALAGREPGRAPLAVSLIVGGDADALRGAVESVLAAQALRLAAVEIAPAIAADAGALDEALGLLGRIASAVPCYVELPWQARHPQLLARLAAAGAHAKLRTGGTTSEAFPSEEQLAEAIGACLDAGVAFKCTAGLHHAVRHTAIDTGFEHHGYLNVVLAAHAAAEGAPPGELVRWLAQREPGALQQRLQQLQRAGVARARAFFRSFGTCDLEDPITEAVSWGLLSHSVPEGSG